MIEDKKEKGDKREKEFLDEIERRRKNAISIVIEQIVIGCILKLRRGR